MLFLRRPAFALTLCVMLVVATPLRAVAPTLSAIAPVLLAEDTNSGPIAFTITDPDTDPASFVVTASSSDPAVVAASGITLGGAGENRTVAIQPVANASGQTTITLTATFQDETATTTIDVTVTAVNDPPTISDIGPQSTTQGTPTGPIAFTVGDVDNGIGILVVSGTSSNQVLVPDAGIAFSGNGLNRTVRITPAAGQVGSATITVTVSDRSAESSKTFLLTVSAGDGSADDRGYRRAGDGRGRGDGPDRVQGGDPDTALASLVVTASSDNPALVPLANITLGGVNPNRTITIAPAPNQSGSATITVTVSDGTTAVSDTFTLTVQPVNDLPTFMGVPSSVSSSEDAIIGPIAFTVADVDHPLSLVQVSVASSNASLLPPASLTLTGANGSYALTLAPVANASGTATVTLTAADPLGAGTAQIAVTITAVNDAPTISDIGDSSTTQENATPPMAFTIGDVDSTVTCAGVTASSTNTVLVPNTPANLVVSGTGTSCTIVVRPASGQQGTSIITVTVSDGALTASDTFVLTVTAGVAPPTISDIGPQVTTEDVPTGAIAFTVGDPDTALASLVVTASSDNPALVPLANITLGGVNPDRTITIAPAPNQSGSATITVTVSDGTTAVSDTFVLTVTGVDDPPTISDIGPQATAEDVATGAIAFTVGDPGDGAGLAGGDGEFRQSGAGAAGEHHAGRRQPGPHDHGHAGGEPERERDDHGDGLGRHDGGERHVRADGDGRRRSADDQRHRAAGNGRGRRDRRDRLHGGGPDTALASLVVTASSDNPALVPLANITLGGVNPDRTITITPAPNQSGSATITVTVSDGTTAVSDTFVLTVTGVDDPPTISDIGPQATAEDVATGASRSRWGIPTRRWGRWW